MDSLHERRRVRSRPAGRRAVALAAIVALITPAAIAVLAQPAAAAGGDLTTIAGDGTPAYNGDGIAATGAELQANAGVAVDAQDNVIIADTNNNRVRVIAKSGSNPGYPLGGCGGACTWTVGDIFTIAGDGTNGYNGDGISATAAEIYEPIGVTIDPAGNVIFGDYFNARVRVVAVSGSNPGYPLGGCGGACTWTVGDIFTVAGNGVGTYGGDGGPATSAQLFAPEGVALDPGGNVVIDDYANNRIRVVAVSGSNPGYPLGGCGGACTWTVGDIFTVAGDGTAAYGGDGGSAVSASLWGPTGVTVDHSGNLVISDAYNYRMRVVAVSGSNPGYPLAGCGGTCTWTVGDIYTAAGNGTSGDGGDGGIATSGEVDLPYGVNVDAAGNIVVAEFYGARVRVIAMSPVNPGYQLAACGGTCTWTTGALYTVAGNGVYGYNGEGVNATSAELNFPAAVAFDSQGDLLIADENNNRVRFVENEPFSVPHVTSPVSGPVSVGRDAVWTVPITNGTAAPLQNVTVTLHASANGATPLTFDGALMPGCAPGAGNSEVCNLADIPAHTAVRFDVFVPTTALSVGTTITGDIDVAATGATDATGTLDTVTVISCGSACVDAVALPGDPLASTSGPPTAAKPTKQVLVLPGNQADAPPVAVNLNSIAPAAAPSSDRRLCPISGTATRCSGQISVVAGDFGAYTDKAHPVQIQIITFWGNKIPPGKILMQKGAGIPPIQLAKCAKNATTLRYNTPCARPETVTGSAAAGNLTTTDIILFIGTDPHCARRLVSTPDAPTALKATAGAKKATIQWKAPVVTNGAITGYVVTAYIGTAAKKTVTFASAAVKETVTGLVTGKTYTFKIAAKNAHGLSFQSIASNAVKPT